MVFISVTVFERKVSRSSLERNGYRCAVHKRYSFESRVPLRFPHSFYSSTHTSPRARIVSPTAVAKRGGRLRSTYLDRVTFRAAFPFLRFISPITRMRFPELIYDRAIFKPCALNSGAWLVESLKSKVRMRWFRWLIFPNRPLSTRNNISPR